MRRPNETDSTELSPFEAATKYIENCIENKSYTFVASDIEDSKELRKWLKSWGWKLTQDEFDDIIYFNLVPA